MGLSVNDCCIKCDKASELLTCSDKGCPIVVHEKCLGVKAKLDEAGNFYCPFCSYRRVTEELHQAREKVVYWKKALSSFIGLQIDNINAQESHIQHKDKEIAAPGCTISACPSKGIDMPSDNAGVGAGDNQLMLGEHKELSGPVVAHAHDDTSSDEDGTTRRFEMVKIGMATLQRHNQLADNFVGSFEDHSEENHSTESHETGKKGLENEFSSSMEEEMEEHTKEINSSFDSDAAISMKCKRISEPNSSGKHVKHNSRKDPNDGLRRSFQNRSPALRPVVEQTKKNSPSIELKKRNRYSTVSPRSIIHGLRRKNLPWSEDEVEMLQKPQTRTFLGGKYWILESMYSMRLVILMISRINGGTFCVKKSKDTNGFVRARKPSPPLYSAVSSNPPNLRSDVGSDD